MSKTSELMKKVSIVLTSGIAISTLTSCGAVQPTYETSNQVEEIEDTSSSSYDDSSEVTDEIDEDEYSITEPPFDENCTDWELDEEDGVWICNDQSSSFYRNFFFMGSYFATKNMLHNNNQFKQYKSSRAVTGTGTNTTKSGGTNGTTTRSGSGTTGTTTKPSGSGTSGTTTTPSTSGDGGTTTTSTNDESETGDTTTTKSGFGSGVSGGYGG